MAKKKIALDCGHGLKTTGKQTPDGIKEWTLNDKVRDKVVENLKDYDVEFIFPDNNEGDTDEGLTVRRTMYVNAKVDVAVSIHHNANTGTWNTATGVEVYVDRSATEKDRELASLIYNNMVKELGMKGRGIKEANWTVINQNTVPAVLTEGGFMDGIEDYKIITTDAGQSKYAKAISDALIVFLKLDKIKEKETAVSRLNAKVIEWQKAAMADGFEFPMYGADGEWGNECESVAEKAIVKKRLIYKYRNLTKIVQRAVGLTGDDVDGKCGKTTKAYIIEYQKRNGLKQDGCVGLNTRKVILGI